MKGFSYNGLSTNDIIDTPLILCSFNGASSSVVGVSRSDNTGEQTITRHIPNEYGTISSPLVFEYSLMKIDFSEFTQAEQIKIERWLTSPKKSKKLTVFDCDNITEPYYYMGKFLHTEWVFGADGFAGVNFLFLCNSAYPMKDYVLKMLVQKEVNGQTVLLSTTKIPVNGNYSVAINCMTDELEEYIYPTVEFQYSITDITDEIVTYVGAELLSDYDVTYLLSRTVSEIEPGAIGISGSGRVSPDIFTEPNVIITNKTDDNLQMLAIVKRGITAVFDCKNCIPWTYTASTDDNTKDLITYKDLGWQDVGNIYWLRLLPGENVLNIQGNGYFSLRYSYPYKKAGGWL